MTPRGRRIIRRRAPAGAGKWSLDALSPLIWTDAAHGVTIGGRGTLVADAGTYIPFGATPVPTGPDWTLTAVAGGPGPHYVAATGTSLVASYEEITTLVRPGTAAWFYLACGINAGGFFNGQTGAVGSSFGANYLSHQTTTIPGSPYLKLSLRCIHTAGNTERFGISDADGSTTWTATGAENILFRPISSYGLDPATFPDPVLQQRVTTWNDIRGNGLFWTQSNTSVQPIFWPYDNGPALVLGYVTSWMHADSLAANFSGNSIPAAMAAAVDHAAGTTPRRLWSLGNSVTIASHALRLPNSGTVYAQGARTDDALVSIILPTLNGAQSQGAVVDVYDGAARSLLWTGIPEVSAAVVLGATTLDRFTIGASRGATVTNVFRGHIREIAMSAGASALWTPGQRAIANQFLSSKYGYA